MLGIEKTNIIIKEPFASQIREKLKRYREGNFTEEEKERLEKLKENCSKYHATWFDKNGKIIFEG